MLSVLIPCNHYKLCGTYTRPALAHCLVRLLRAFSANLEVSAMFLMAHEHTTTASRNRHRDPFSSCASKPLALRCRRPSPSCLVCSL